VTAFVDTVGVKARLTYEVDDVGVRFQSSEGPIEVLQDVSFRVAVGEIVGVVGRSGTGKTTLLRVLGGLLAPTSGTVRFDGRPLQGPPGTVVTVFQDYGNALLPWRTIARNVGLGLEGRVTRAEQKERVTEALELVGLHGRATDYPWRLSGGMQQRVQIARALALHPRVLLMDEPFGALDAITKAVLQDELLRVQERTGATIVFITHDLEEAIYLSDRVFAIAGTPGRIAVQADTELPRPRDQIETRELPKYLELRHGLWEALRLEGS
jgi:NitT/TauT family transport system ATP-binding protein